MPFIRRDASGQISALYREQAAEAGDYLPPNHPEVLGFMGMVTPPAPSQSSPEPAPSEGRGGNMVNSDLEMIRVYEDLVDILISKHVVVLTDFPQAAQEKLMRRKRLRSSFSSLTEALAVEEDEGIFRI